MQPMSHFKTFQALEKKKEKKRRDQNRWMGWIFHGSHFRPRRPTFPHRLLHFRQSYPSSPALIPPPLSVKSPRIARRRSNNRTALPPIRIANPAALQRRAQSQDAGRKTSEMTKLCIKTVRGKVWRRSWALLVWVIEPFPTGMAPSFFSTWKL